VLQELPLNSREIILLLLLVALLMREVLQLRRKKWFIQWLSPILPSQKALEGLKARQMKPKSQKRLPTLPKEQAKETETQLCPHSLIPWSAMKKGKGGRPKQSITQGHVCLKPDCYYCGITDQTIRALIANGSPGNRGSDLPGVSGRVFPSPQYPALSAQNSFPSRGKSHAAGNTWVEPSVLEEVYQVRESTITTIIKHTSTALLSPIISRAANKWLIIETAIIFFGKD
jgi:hypothetical protein